MTVLPWCRHGPPTGMWAGVRGRREASPGPRKWKIRPICSPPQRSAVARKSDHSKRSAPMYRFARRAGRPLFGADCRKPTPGRICSTRNVTLSAYELMSRQGKNEASEDVSERVCSTGFQVVFRAENQAPCQTRSADRPGRLDFLFEPFEFFSTLLEAWAPDLLRASETREEDGWHAPREAGLAAGAAGAPAPTRFLQ